MRHVCTEREIERKKEKEKEIERLFELKPSLVIVYILKSVSYSNKQK
tara:strand:+ start:492 stop:632 length:141 start_codon:yes stop_codon:yes gene_type:complete